MSFELSTGTFGAWSNDEHPDGPILQILHSKHLQSNNVLRIRLYLSDGVHTFQTCMLGSQLNPLHEAGELNDFTIIKLKNYQVNLLHGSKRLIIILDLEVLHSADEVGHKIGNPIPFVKGASVSTGGSGQPSSKAPDENTVPPQKKLGNPPSNMFSPKPTGKLPFGKDQAPTTPGGTQTRVMPIGSLTPYQNKWSIKARVSQKGTMREWKNAKGEGKLFSFTVLDESGDIRITCFKEEADRFYDLIEVGKIFYISNASLKPANAQYNNTSHDYEMTLRRDSQITLCEKDDGTKIPKIQYNFKKISSLEQSINNLVDVIGVVKSVDELNTVMIRSQNRETQVRKFTIVDRSGSEVTVTLWGKEAEQFNGDGNPVVAIKGAKVSDFNNCSLSTIGSTVMSSNPDIPEAYDLKQWFNSGGSTQATQNLTTSGGGGGTGETNWKILSDIKSENLGMGEKPDYITAKVTILYCKKENILYKACSTDQCNKKVIDLEQGQYRCEKCNKTSDTFKYRLILNMHVADEYDSVWVTCFQEQGEILLSRTAQELGELQQNESPEFESTLQSINFKSYFMKFRVKMDRFNDEDRVRVTVISVSPISYVDYTKKLRSDIEKLVQE